MQHFLNNAHFTSGFTAEKPKPNSLVYLYDAEEENANWYSYDEITKNR